MSKFDELKAAYAAATSGEWTVGPSEKGTSVECGPCILAHVNGTNAGSLANAEFTALAHNVMPTLLEAVELLKMAAHALETPGDFTPEEMQEQVIGDIGAFLAHLEGV